MRHAITKLSDIHLVASLDAQERVLKLGEDSEYVIVTGCPSIDIANEIYSEMSHDFDPIKKYGGVGVDHFNLCLLYTSDAADERSSVDLGGRRIIKKKT